MSYTEPDWCALHERQRVINWFSEQMRYVEWTIRDHPELFDADAKAQHDRYCEETLRRLRNFPGLDRLNRT